jgi:hypothetical protein
MPCGSTGGKVMKKNGKIRFLAEDEIELEQIKSDLKVIRLALLQEILKQAKSMDPDPNMIARLSSIYLKVSARLEKMIRDIPAEDIQDEIENDPVYKMGFASRSVIKDDEYPPSIDKDFAASLFKKDYEDSSPDCHCEESHLEGRRSNLNSDNTDCHGDPPPSKVCSGMKRLRRTGYASQRQSGENEAQIATGLRPSQ